MEFSHFDEKGNAWMVDVSEKKDTTRTAIAQGFISMNTECFQKVKEGSMKKGDVLTVAQIAGIMGAKRCSDLLPLCHPLPLSKCEITFEFLENQIQVTCLCKTTGKTGVEMEALTGVQVALLTIYDMCKAIDKKMVMSDIHLVEKTGGKSGDFKYIEEKIL